MVAHEDLDRLCCEHGLISGYLFSSRAEDGLSALVGKPVADRGSDLDIEVVFGNADLMEPEIDPWALSKLKVALEALFALVHIDLVPLQKVDTIFQFYAISVRRIAETRPTRDAYCELANMRLGSEVLPIQREPEHQQFCWSST